MDIQPDKNTSTNYDIVIVGAGPAGLMLSTCLARWGYRIKHIDNRAEPTATGRADGIQPRSLDLLRNMGLKSAIMAHKPARVYEVAFWDQREDGGGDGQGEGIVRTGTWASCPDFIDARYPFTTLLHQGFIERVFIADLEKNGVEIQRPWTIREFRSEEKENLEYPVEVKLGHIDGTMQETVRAKYMFSGEGARSFVREQLKIEFKHKDPIAHVWGVMDGLVETDFPDIKMKCTIHSKHGSIMVIPREDNMVRLYVQIASSTDADWSPRKTATEKEVQDSAKKILRPYSIEWERVEWYSVYPIGQGISERYTLDHRVFLGGDACHTHSPKAGQGMNTAFLDAQNLAWKIHAVEGGLADRTLLQTYESERKGVAEALLAFDNKYAKLFSQRSPAASEVHASSSSSPQATAKPRNPDSEEENEFVRTFKEGCAFTSGYGVAYGPNALNWSRASHPAQSPLILDDNDDDNDDNDDGRGTTMTTRLRPGRLLANADVTRVVDANVVHLEQEVALDGTFRIFVFAGAPSDAGRARVLADLAAGLARPGSFFSSFSSSSTGDHRHHHRFFTFCIIFAAARRDVDMARHVPALLARRRHGGHVYADDRGDGRVPGAAHAKMGFDAGRGGVVVVRPDGYVGVVVGLVEGGGTVDALNEYFGAFCRMKKVERPMALL